MKLTLEIRMDNAAFVDDPAEITRIIHQVADWADGRDATDLHPIRDINGQRVGAVRIEA